MKKILIIVLVALLSFSVFSKKTNKKQVVRKTEKVGNIIYKYREHEKFDFDELSIGGETGNPGDLSVIQKKLKRYKYPLPYRRNFGPAIRRAVESVK